MRSTKSASTRPRAHQKPVKVQAVLAFASTSSYRTRCRGARTCGQSSRTGWRSSRNVWWGSWRYGRTACKGCGHASSHGRARWGCWRGSCTPWRTSCRPAGAPCRDGRSPLDRWEERPVRGAGVLARCLGDHPDVAGWTKRLPPIAFAMGECWGSIRGEFAADGGDSTAWRGRTNPSGCGHRAVRPCAQSPGPCRPAGSPVPRTPEPTFFGAPIRVWACRRTTRASAAD